MESSLHPVSNSPLIELKHTTFPKKKGFETLHCVEKFLIAFLNGQGIFLFEFLDHGAPRGSCVDGTTWFDHRESDSMTVLLP
jgi:hypothetical protein